MADALLAARGITVRFGGLTRSTRWISTCARRVVGIMGRTAPEDDLFHHAVRRSPAHGRQTAVGGWISLDVAARVRRHGARGRSRHRACSARDGARERRLRLQFAAPARGPARDRRRVVDPRVPRLDDVATASGGCADAGASATRSRSAWPSARGRPCCCWTRSRPASRARVGAVTTLIRRLRAELGWPSSGSSTRSAPDGGVDRVVVLHEGRSSPRPVRRRGEEPGRGRDLSRRAERPGVSASLSVRGARRGYGVCGHPRRRSRDRRGPLTVLLGPNGAGKTTSSERFRVSFRTRVRCGSTGRRAGVAEAIVARGLGHVPEGRQLFAGMTVRRPSSSAPGPCRRVSARRGCRGQRALSQAGRAAQPAGGS